MSKIIKFGDNSDNNSENVSNELSSIDPVPQPLKEIMKLINKINQLLENCADNLQRSVSKKQLRILNANCTTLQPWEQALLSRTYYTDKKFDEGFKKLQIDTRNFIIKFQNFVTKLRGEHLEQQQTMKNRRDIYIQTITKELATPKIGDKKLMVTPLDLSLLDEKSDELKINRRRSKRIATSNVQQSFADLIKAKMELDNKFLGFEEALNGDNNEKTTPVDPSATQFCLCQICSNILGLNNESIYKDGETRPKIRKLNQDDEKKLIGCLNEWKKNDENDKQSISIDNIDDNK